VRRDAPLSARRRIAFFSDIRAMTPPAVTNAGTTARTHAHPSAYQNTDHVSTGRFAMMSPFVLMAITTISKDSVQHIQSQVQTRAKVILGWFMCLGADEERGPGACIAIPETGNAARRTEAISIPTDRMERLLGTSLRRLRSKRGYACVSLSSCPSVGPVPGG
jgi:hypothetical protein